MADDPPKKEVPTEVMIPSAPSTTRGAIRYTNTISRKQFAQLSGAEPPQLCAVAIEAEVKARERLNADKSDRWLYLVAHGQLELELLLEIRRYERIGARKGYAVRGLKKTNKELSEFFRVTAQSMSRTTLALRKRGVIENVDGVLQLRYSAILKAAKTDGWSV